MAAPLLARYVEPRLEAALGDTPVVLIHGPRQCGKTTLARMVGERLGYTYDSDSLRKNLEYYDQRTSHGSTLSFVAHAALLAEIDLKSSWERFMVALESDVSDVQGGTTAEGIHLGVMAGTLDIIQRFYLGERVNDGVLHFNPKPVSNLAGLSMPLVFRGTPLDVALDGGKVRVTVRPGGFTPSLKVGVGDVVKDIKSGQTHVFDTEQ